MKWKISKCPFCGGENVVMVEVEHPDSRREKFIGCCSCGAKGPSSFHDEEKAVEEWNTRAVTAPRHRPAIDENGVITGRGRCGIVKPIREMSERDARRRTHGG